MTELHARFKAVDQLEFPDLWPEIEDRRSAMAAMPASGPGWLAIALTVLLILGLGSAVLLGSSLVPWPGPSESPSPVPSPEASPPQTSACLPSTPSAPPPPTGESAWTATSEMVFTRMEGHEATLLADGVVLVTGGGAGRVPPPSPSVRSELFDPASASWSAIAGMGSPRSGHTATLLLDGRVLVAGGGTASAELFDPGSCAWLPAADMDVSRRGHTATLLRDGSVLVAGGTESDSAIRYDPSSGTWAPAGIMSLARDGHSATLLRDGRVLVVSGGIEAAGGVPGPLVVDLYDPTVNIWSQTSSLPLTAGWAHEAVLLDDGRVLVVGGYPGSPAGRGYLFDSDSESWTTGAGPNEPRAWFSLTLLEDGRVLAAGGGDGGVRGSATAELFDPTRNSWAFTDDMLGLHGWHEAAALDDGRVLIVGGVWDGGTGSGGPDAELYDSDAAD